MSVNTEKLKEVIIEKNTTQENVADSLEINRSTFYRKMRNHEKSFSVEEAQKMVELIPLTMDEAVEIFFNKKVAFTQQKTGAVS